MRLCVSGRAPRCVPANTFAVLHYGLTHVPEDTCAVFHSGLARLNASSLPLLASGLGQDASGSGQTVEAGNTNADKRCGRRAGIRLGASVRQWFFSTSGVRLLDKYISMPVSGVSTACALYAHSTALTWCPFFKGPLGRRVLLHSTFLNPFWPAPFRAPPEHPLVASSAWRSHAWPAPAYKSCAGPEGGIAKPQNG